MMGTVHLVSVTLHVYIYKISMGIYVRHAHIAFNITYMSIPIFGTVPFLHLNLVLKNELSQ